MLKRASAAGLSLFIAALGACAPKPAATPEPVAPPPAAEAAKLFVNVLDCGELVIADLDGFSTSGDYKGVADTFTDTCYLVRHPNGILLWDLGVPGILRAAGPYTEGGMTVSLKATLTEQLASLGLTPADIDYFSLSHSHFDHVGQVDQVTGAIWIVHQAELEAMLPADGTDAKVSADQLAAFNLFKPLKREVFTGEKDVFGDGSVVIFETPGHTPGHASLQLKLPETGPVLLSGDLYHRAESRALKRVPKFNFNEAQTRASFEAFEARAAALGAKVIIQHEPADIEPLGGVLR